MKNGGQNTTQITKHLASGTKDKIGSSGRHSHSFSTSATRRLVNVDRRDGRKLTMHLLLISKITDDHRLYTNFS